MNAYFRRFLYEFLLLSMWSPLFRGCIAAIFVVLQALILYRFGIIWDILYLLVFSNLLPSVQVISILKHRGTMIFGLVIGLVISMFLGYFLYIGPFISAGYKLLLLSIALPTLYCMIAFNRSEPQTIPQNTDR